MIEIYEMLPIAGLVVDVMLIGLVGALLHRLAKDPTKKWQAREQQVASLHDSLRLLVTQAEGQARTLDGDLSAHAERLRGLLERAERVERLHGAEAADAAPTSARTPLRARVASLSRSGLDLDEIAAEMNMPLAEVRLLVGLDRSSRERTRVAHAGGQE